MTLYQMVYKCRLCGCVYSAGETEKESGAWEKYLRERARIDGIVPRVEGIPSVLPTMFEMHWCKDGSRGIADFQGMKYTPDGKTIGTERENEQ